jgi:hypothetical protein
MNVVQVFSGEGDFISLLGDEKGLPLDLGSPNGLAFIEPDLLVISEKLSRRIQIRRVLDIFLADTIQDDEPQKDILEERIYAPSVPQSKAP